MVDSSNPHFDIAFSSRLQELMKKLQRSLVGTKLVKEQLSSN